MTSYNKFEESQKKYKEIESNLQKIYERFYKSATEIA